VEHIVKGFHFTAMSKLLKTTRMYELLLTGTFTLRWLVLPLIQKPSLSTVLNICPMFMVAGYYLAFFFIISHNFEGVHLFDKTKDKKGNSFLYYQVASSSNVGGSWLCTLNGGLNYQIEHHLFPRMNHTYYPKIAPYVKAYCESKGIPYRHFPTVSDNILSCARHLYAFGSEKVPKYTGLK
jgi:fatty acid desaturase (delta-4 desaturase)